MKREKIKKYVMTSLVAGSLLIFFTQGLEAATQARADLVNAQGVSVGQILFQQIEGGVQIVGSLHDLPAGEHAFHIHGSALANATDFQSAGGHYNPENKQHGLENAMGHHAGDMANFIADDQGNAHFEVINTAVSLEEEVPNSLFKEGGTSIIIHEGPDDHVSDPAGNAGGRIAGGTIIAE